MRRKWFWVILGVAVGSLISSFLILFVFTAEQYEGNSIINEQYLARSIDLHFHLLIDQRNHMWDDMTLERDPVVLSLAQESLEEDFLYAAWYDPDGQIESWIGDWIPENFESTIFFETVLYSYGESISEIALHNDIIHLQTARIMDDDRIVLLGTKLEGVFSEISVHYGGREIAVFYGNERAFIANIPYQTEQVPTLSGLFRRSMDAQRPMSETLIRQGRPTVFTSLPIFDADHWGVIGFLCVLTPTSYWDAGLGWLRASVIVMAIFSGLIAFLVLYGFFRPKPTHDATVAMQQPRSFIWKGTLAFIPALIMSIYFGYVTVPSIMGETTTTTWKLIAPYMAEDFHTNQSLIIGNIDDQLRKLRGLTRSDYVVFLNNSPQESTIHPRMLTRLSQPDPITKTSTYEIGHILLNRVEHKYLSFSMGAHTMMVLREETDMLNIVLSIQFFSIGLAVSLLVLALIFSFMVVNIDHPKMIKRTMIGYVFLAPAIVHLVWWAAGPMAFSLFLAFRRWSVVDPAKPFIGFGNFIELFQDGPFWNALKNTAVYALHVPLGMALSLLLAMAVNKAGKVAILLRVLYYLPVVTAGVATTIVWRWIFNRDFGMLNYILSFFGISKIAWLDSPQFALPAIMIISIWGAIGSQMLIYLAGLQGIPMEFYDAASVDGANKVKRFRHITLPLLKPTSLFVLVTSVIGSFQVFTPIYVLTQGGPLRSTDVVFYHIWESAWVDMRMGYAAAQSWILFGVLALLTFLEFKMFGKDSWKAYS